MSTPTLGLSQMILKPNTPFHLKKSVELCDILRKQISMRVWANTKSYVQDV